MNSNSFSRDRGSRAVDVRLLIVHGVAAAKAGDDEEARRYLERVLRADPEEHQAIEAWLWLSRISVSPEEKRGYLEEILARRPGDARARRELALLRGTLRPEELVNPDRLAPAEDGPRPADTRRFICPRCAARMVFSPDGESLLCEHCGYGQEPPRDTEVDEQDFITAMATARGHRQPVNMQTFQCDGCSASFLLAPAALSVTCPYCHATYAARVKETRELIAPEAIIPFTIDQERAQRAADRWLARKQYASRAPLNGFYLPVWTFDVGGAIEWTGIGQRYNPGGPAFRGEGYSEMEVVSGRLPLFVDDYLVPGSAALPAQLREVLESYDLEQLLAFKAEYLAAWPAQTYEIAVGDASLQARTAVFKQEQQEAQARIKSSRSLRKLRLSSAGISVLSYKLILLPLWMAHYSHKGISYALAVNGQSGELRAQEPPGLTGTGGWLKRLLG